MDGPWSGAATRWMSTLFTYLSQAFSLDTLRQRIQGASSAQIRLSVLDEAGEVEELDVDDPAGLRFPDLSSLND
jgi:hypothetical protein